MELDSRYTGTRLKTYGTSIDARHSMNYAAAVSDVNPVYFDDERAGGILAPPMFSVALTWPILENIGAYILAETFPRQLLLTQVHHTEHLHFHRPVLPGEDVSVRGHIAAILPHRAGTRVVICLEAQDANERPVFMEYLGAMLRGVTCRGGGRGEADLPVTPARRMPGARFGRQPFSSSLSGPIFMMAAPASFSPSTPPDGLPARWVCRESSCRAPPPWPLPPGKSSTARRPGIPLAWKAWPAVSAAWCGRGPPSEFAWWGDPPANRETICFSTLRTKKDNPSSAMDGHRSAVPAMLMSYRCRSIFWPSFFFERI